MYLTIFDFLRRTQEEFSTAKAARIVKNRKR